MSDYICIVLYMISCVLFIMGIKKLGKADTARKGNLYSSAGMLIAVVSVLISQDVIDGGLVSYLLIIFAIAGGSVVGFIWAKKVEMTGMPQLVALFNGFGGLSSMLVAISQFIAGVTEDAFTALTLGLTILIGAVAFTGSIIAWGKLAGLKIFKKNFAIPGKNFINAGILAVAALGILFICKKIRKFVQSAVNGGGIFAVADHCINLLRSKPDAVKTSSFLKCGNCPLQFRPSRTPKLMLSALMPRIDRQIKIVTGFTPDIFKQLLCIINPPGDLVRSVHLFHTDQRDF